VLAQDHHRVRSKASKRGDEVAKLSLVAADFIKDGLDLCRWILVGTIRVGANKPCRPGDCL
jgi:hypothetical protein